MAIRYCGMSTASPGTASEVDSGAVGGRYGGGSGWVSSRVPIRDVVRPEPGGQWRCSGWSEHTCDQCSYSGKALVGCFG
jgi:hypothetical protein